LGLGEPFSLHEIPSHQGIFIQVFGMAEAERHYERSEAIPYTAVLKKALSLHKIPSHQGIFIQVFGMTEAERHCERSEAIPYTAVLKKALLIA